MFGCFTRCAESARRSVGLRWKREKDWDRLCLSLWRRIPCPTLCGTLIPASPFLYFARSNKSQAPLNPLRPSATPRPFESSSGFSPGRCLRAKCFHDQQTLAADGKRRQLKPLRPCALIIIIMTKCVRNKRGDFEF